MTQYLSKIKSKCDVIAVFRSTLSLEDIVFYTLNGLPSSYQNFKTSIQTNLNLISLDDFFALLCSEELNLHNDAPKESYHTSPIKEQFSLLQIRGKGRSRSNYKGRGGNNSTNYNAQQNFGDKSMHKPKTPSTPIQC